MSGDTEIDDPEVSEGNSENEYSEHEQEDPDAVGIEEDDNTDMAESKFKAEEDENGKAGTTGTTKPKLDPKDPLRPRRKKARRACFACQRAHLTCGDERPCQRCIKRGLADACQDGVRKKAKYLHDAPPEALRPVLGPNYNQVNNARSNNVPPTTSASDTSPGAGGFFSQPDASPSYSIYNQPNPMPPPIQARLSFASQQSPLSPTFQQQINRQNVMQGLPSAPQPSTDMSMIFDPSNPALFNFDLEGLNFGNHYGALEFGMLNHMSSGAAETPSKDSISSQGMSTVGFNNGSAFGNNIDQFGQPYSQEMLPDFVGMDGRNTTGIYSNNLHHSLPHAYAIATGPLSHHSPSTEASPGASGIGFESPTTTYTPSATPHPHRPPKRQDSKTLPSQKLGASSVLGKRTRDASSIYDTVHEPYSYTTGFHGLTAFLQKRFSPNKTLRIAKSLASIRPSFISCTKTLNRQDLIFMEKCFQRTLFEYEEFMLNCCTPTLVCRRTGEVAAVNKEFTLLTGWTKDVLLGKEANLNVNTGKSATNSGPSSVGNSRLATPRIRPMILPDGKPNRPQPVFLAELLDDDSVVEFYEDFARLAFGDSRGSVTTKCRLLKYQTKEGLVGGSPEQGGVKSAAGSEEKSNGGSGSGKLKGQSVGLGSTMGLIGPKVSQMEGEHGIGVLQRDGKMDCSYCWTVKRDVFDIPMLIVMNFLPCI